MSAPQFSYSGDPSASPLDEVRFLIQDTVAASRMFNDAEITYAIAKKGSPVTAAIGLCQTLARKFASQPGSKTIGDITIMYSDLADRYLRIAAALEAESTRDSTPVPYAGGISLSDTETVRSDDDRNAPATEVDWSNGGTSLDPSARYR